MPEYRHTPYPLHGIRDEEGYLACARPGRGTRLPRGRRAAVWRVIAEEAGRLRAAGRWTYLQLADEAARVLRERAAPYRHVVVDEAQDLHPGPRPPVRLPHRRSEPLPARRSLTSGLRSPVQGLVKDRLAPRGPGTPPNRTGGEKTP